MQNAPVLAAGFGKRPCGGHRICALVTRLEGPPQSEPQEHSFLEYLGGSQPSPYVLRFSGSVVVSTKPPTVRLLAGDLGTAQLSTVACSGGHVLLICCSLCGIGVIHFGD